MVELTGGRFWKPYKDIASTVLDPGKSGSSGVYLYAHCLRDHPEGVALLAINADRDTAHDIQLAISAERYTLTVHELEDTAIALNGVTLRAGADGSLPALNPVRTAPGRVTLAAASIAFLAIPGAANSSCR